MAIDADRQYVFSKFTNNPGSLDGTLRSLDTITRTKMLTLLGRRVKGGWLNPVPERRLEKWIQTVNLDSRQTRTLTGSTGSCIPKAG